MAMSCQCKADRTGGSFLSAALTQTIEVNQMVQASPEIARARAPRAHHFREFALDVAFGASMMIAGVASFAWLCLSIGGGQ